MHHKDRRLGRGEENREVSKEERIFARYDSMRASPWASLLNAVNMKT